MPLLCPCCRAAAADLELFEVTRTIDACEARIVVCRQCTALINEAELAAPEEAVRALNEEGSVEFYGGDWDGYRREIEKCSSLVEFVMSEFGGAGPRSLLEFGFGSGCFLLAAAERIPEVFGVDLNHVTIRGILANSGRSVDQLRLYQNISEVSAVVDAVFCWHVLEHLKDARGLIDALGERLRTQGMLFFQVPLYRPAHICRTHITFLSAASVACLFDVERWERPKLMFDVANAFLTGVVRRR